MKCEFGCGQRFNGQKQNGIVISELMSLMKSKNTKVTLGQMLSKDRKHVKATSQQGMNKAS